MKNKEIVMRCAMIAVLPFAALAYGDLFTFDRFQNNEVLTDDLLSFGLLFEPISWKGVPNDPNNPLELPTVKDATAQGTGRTGKVLTPSVPSASFQNVGEFHIEFVQPGNPTEARTVDLVGAEFFDVEFPGTRIEAYDVSGNLIGEVDVPVGPNLAWQYAEIAVQGIQSVIFRLGQPLPIGDGVVMDNLKVIGPNDLGDLNCDGTFNGADIDPFFLVLGDTLEYLARFPTCNIMLGDMNQDGFVNGADIDPFFACLGGGGCP